MPTSKTLGYDHPAYQVPVVFPLQTVAGANGVSLKYAAFTALQIRSVALTPNIASTSASQPLMYVKSGTATSTTTLTALTSAAITPLPNLLATAVSLAAGDHFWITHGTDATAVLAGAAEAYLTPGAAVSAP